MIKIWNLGLMSFDTVYKIQSILSTRHLRAVAKGETYNFNTLLICEHKPVYTVGLRDDTPKSEVLKLMSLGAEFRRTNRGGLTTFHGPGQLVAYPIINLKNFKPSVKWYVQSLEETVISLCRELGLYAYRSPDTGVWVNDNKLAAIGIHASRYITTHGVALNCDNNLSWFDHIIPCGIIGKGVTSLTKEAGQQITVTKIIPMFIDHFSQIFGCSTETLGSKTKADILSTVYSELMEKPEIS